MSDDIKQKISSLMDEEIDSHADETINNLMKNKSLHDTWWRYHLISDALKQDLPDSMDRYMVDRIADDIAKGPIVFTPNRIVSSPFFKPVVGFAIAATVAIIAILGIQQNSTAPGLQQQLSVQITDNVTEFNTNISQYTLPVSSNVIATRVQQVNDIESNSRLKSYLVNYNEYRTTQTGVQGIIPYVRIIANENDQ